MTNLIDINDDKVILFYLASGRQIASRLSYINGDIDKEAAYVLLKKAWRIDQLQAISENQTMISVTPMNNVDLYYDLYAELFKDDVISKAIEQSESKIVRPKLVQ
jgi:hypothetical protein